MAKPKEIPLPELLNAITSLSNEDLLKLMEAAEKEHQTRVKKASDDLDVLQAGINLKSNN